jgi:hypothetical protein
MVPAARVFRPAASAVVRKNYLPSARLVPKVAGSFSRRSPSSADYEPAPVESFLIDEILERATAKHCLHENYGLAAAPLRIEGGIPSGSELSEGL